MPIQIHWPLVILALVCEYVDSTLGMGYGTTLTPILLLAGYGTTQIVPSVLLSEFLTGILAGTLHHEYGNVNFKPGSRSLKVVLVLTACSVVGTLAAVFLAVNVPGWLLKTYIGILVLSMGIGILLTIGRNFAFSWKKVIGLGLVAAFNKGISGGGYGPLVTGGQILAGVDSKGAIGITSLAEGLVCIVGVLAYTLTGNGAINWGLAPSLILGAVISVPFAALTVKKAPVQKMRWAIGIAVTLLGIFTLAKLVL
ncbi:MAG: sulfite exporter TauE/SafE family protein [Chloroflexota bacterium]|nr:sulfite exporter TauE/SafE family protein [Chloroflexota bacterium]